MQINSAQRKPKSSAEKKAKQKQAAISRRTQAVRRDKRLSIRRTPHTLDAAIRNCTRSLDVNQHVGVPQTAIHDKFWNGNKLGALMAVKNGLIPFVVVG